MELSGAIWNKLGLLPAAGALEAHTSEAVCPERYVKEELGTRVRQDLNIGHYNCQ